MKDLGGASVASWLGAMVLLAGVVVREPVYADLVINELLADNSQTNFDEEGDNEDWAEFYNSGPEVLRLEGYALSDDPLLPQKWLFPDIELFPGEYLLVWLSGKDRYEPPPDVIGGDSGLLAFEPVFIDDESEWLYRIAEPGTAGPPPGWNEVGFVDQSFVPGRAGFGYGDGDDSTELPVDTNAVFIRHEFEVVDPARLVNLVLEIDYDDGFVAYLNGERVASGSAPSTDPNFDSRASGKHEAGTPERFDLTSYVQSLNAGTNVLAVVGLNDTPSSDMSLRPRLGVIDRVLHANFRLERNGETVTLADPEGTVLESVTLPPQTEDHSFGRSPDATGPWRYLLTPTPEAPNVTQAFDEPISATVEFDPPPGRYAGGVNVTLTASPGDQVVVYYTTNGEEPTVDDQEFSGPIRVDANRVFRAAAFIGGERATQPISGSYFIGGTTDLPILSISMDPGEYAEVHNNSGARGRGSERRAYMEFIEASGALGFSHGMGLRLHGGAGRGGDFNTKKSYKVYFRGAYGAKKLRYPLIPSTPVQVFDKLVLRGGFNDSFRTNGGATYLRDQIIRDLHEAMGGLVSHGTWCMLYVNMRPRGLFNIVERMDEEFMSSYIGETDWDVIKTGNDVLVGTRDEWDRLRNFMVENDLSRPELYRAALDLLDIENFTSYMIVNMWAQNHDWPHNNWYAARPRVPEGKWLFLCWDAEFGVGLIPGGYTANSLDFVVGRNGYIRDVFVNLLDSPLYQAYFLEELDRHLQGPLRSDLVARDIGLLEDIVTPDIPEETAFFNRTLANWQNNVDTMLTFARNRNQVFRNHIVSSPHFSDGRLLQPQVRSVLPEVLVNTGDNIVTLSGLRLSESTEVYFDGLQGEVVRALGLGTELEVLVPFDVALDGVVDIRVVEPTTQLFDDLDNSFEVRLPVPQISLLLPAAGARDGGDTVRIIGAHFLEGVQVFFGGVPATDVVRVGGGREELEVVTPSGSGAVDVVVMNTRPAELPSIGSFQFHYEGASFRRGDANSNDVVDISDGISLLNHLFLGALQPPCLASADVDASGDLNLTDGIYLFSVLFLGGNPPPAPYPECGPASESETLPCESSPCA